MKHGVFRRFSRREAQIHWFLVKHGVFMQFSRREAQIQWFDVKHVFSDVLAGEKHKYTGFKCETRVM